MLLNQAALSGIADGTLKAVYRRWDRARVKPGSTLRTAIGVVAVDGVEPVAESSLTDRDAKNAGFATRADLLAELAKYGGGRLYRIRLRLAGPDPRVELRNKSELSETEAEELAERISRLGARTEEGPWALATLRLIARRPGVRAPDLAATLGVPTSLFKPRVRQLKELGLTESLEVGYRLSPRGEALLRRLAQGS